MNSYPHEFLTHPQPLMFVAGLTGTRDRSASTASASAQGSSSRRPSDARQRKQGEGSGLLDPAHSSSLNALTTPITSPSLGQKHSELPSSPPVSTDRTNSISPDLLNPTPPDSTPSEQQERDAEFQQLVEDLKTALEGRNGQGKFWLSEQERKEYRVVLVDKNVRLPARKAQPAAPASNDPYQPPPPVHSPLSPLTPTSPAYPDGLIAPIWVRKHAELVPSVFLLFLRMWECPNPGDLSAEELERKEREEDDVLVKEIAERRRRLGERGIKLTVILMASAAALDSPVLDPRLSYLRRNSALSAKASLFVLTPVPADQLPDFVKSLGDAVWDAAMEYYASHSKKIRRKRTRLPTSAGQGGHQSGVPGRSLGTQGWTVRYDFKAGWFAELRGEIVEARRHYEDCWNELAKMFASTQTLPPRTKRWAEAKVLADCIAVRICRLLLYTGDAQKVLAPFYVHLKRFGDLSRGWGIGEETFEFWSWMARQYRIFGELLEMGQNDNLHIPVHAAPVFPTSSVSTTPPTPEFFATPTSGMNPLHVLQQPAYYFHAAADCTLKRKERFEEALAIEEDAKDSEAGGHIALAPGFANEKKVDHAALAVELYTKAYSLFKEQSHSSSRVALSVAFRIAETYASSSQHELAMRFFARISPTFKEDRWSPIVRQIRKLWYECAQITESVEVAARLLLEMMSTMSGVEGDDRAGLQDDLMSLLKTTQPASTEPIVIETTADSALLQTTSAFWQDQVDLEDRAPFQVSLLCQEQVDISQVRFESLQLSFSDDRPDVTLKAGNGEQADDFVDLGAVGDDGKDRETPALIWTSGKRITLRGELRADQEGEIQVSAVRLTLKLNAWTFELLHTPIQGSGWYTPKGMITPVHELSQSIRFAPRPLLVAMSAEEVSEGYTGERIPIRIKVTSTDDRKLYSRLTVFLQPAEEEDDTTISYADQTSQSLIQDIDLGIIDPQATIQRSVYLQSPIASLRVVDLSLQAGLASLDDEGQRLEEVNHTVTVPIVDPLHASSSVVYRHGSRATGDDGVEGWATVFSTITVPGKRPITVQTIDVDAKSETVQLLTSSLAQSGAETFPQDWTSRTVFSIASKFALLPGRRLSAAIGAPTEPPADIVITWTSTESAESTITRLPLPVLALPPQDSFITAYLRAPPSVTLSTPARVTLSITNSHPSATATSLHVTVDSSSTDSFIWVGPKSTHVAPLPPNATTEVILDVMPVSSGSTGPAGGGGAELPKVRLWEGTGDDREELDVVVLSDRGERVELGGAAVHIRP